VVSGLIDTGLSEVLTHATRDQITQSFCIKSSVRPTFRARANESGVINTIRARARRTDVIGEINILYSLKRI
jgi:hypothetical protein